MYSYKLKIMIEKIYILKLYYIILSGKSQAINSILQTFYKVWEQNYSCGYERIVSSSERFLKENTFNNGMHISL